ncbi:hypothetical protein EMCRGX_G020781 [Ephydatia muelleri]
MAAIRNVLLYATIFWATSCCFGFRLRDSAAEDDLLAAVTEESEMWSEKGIEAETDVKMSGTTKQCSGSAKVTGKSGAQKCDQRYLGVEFSIQVEVPTDNNHNYCTGVKVLAVRQVQDRLPADQTGCLIEAAKYCNGC